MVFSDMSEPQKSVRKRNYHSHFTWGQLGESVPTIVMQVLLDMKRGSSTLVKYKSLPRPWTCYKMLFANLCVGSYPEILSGKLLCIFFPQVSKMNSRSKQQCCRNRTDLQIFCDFVCGFHYHRMLLVLNICLASKDEQVISWKKWKKNVSNTSSDKPTIFNSGLCTINPQK